mgnify:CR=1 FL=1
MENFLSTVKKDITVAIMGCVVNGPTEAKNADIGIAGGKNEALLFKKGQIIRKIKEEDILSVLKEEILKMNKIYNNLDTNEKELVDKKEDVFISFAEKTTFINGVTANKYGYINEDILSAYIHEADGINNGSASVAYLLPRLKGKIIDDGKKECNDE